MRSLYKGLLFLTCLPAMVFGTTLNIGGLALELGSPNPGTMSLSYNLANSGVSPITDATNRYLCLGAVSVAFYTSTDCTTGGPTVGSEAETVNTGDNTTTVFGVPLAVGLTPTALDEASTDAGFTDQNGSAKLSFVGVISDDSSACNNIESYETQTSECFEICWTGAAYQVASSCAGQSANKNLTLQKV